MTPVKGSFDPRGGCNPLVENHCTKQMILERQLAPATNEEAGKFSCISSESLTP